MVVDEENGVRNVNIKTVYVDDDDDNANANRNR